MKKKTLIIAIGISLAVAVIGIVLICMSSTPYQNLSYWLENPYNTSLYLYAEANIGKYTAMYFSGIVMTVIGGIGAVLVFIKNTLAKKEKPISEDVINNLD